MATKSDLLESIIKIVGKTMSSKNTAKHKKGYNRAARKHSRIST